MESDAKLGLVAGLAGVLVVAVVYFQKPTEEGIAANQPNPTAVTGTALTGSATTTVVAPEMLGKAVPVGRPTSYVKPTVEE